MHQTKVLLMKPACVARHSVSSTAHVACNMMNVQLQTNAVSASFPSFPASFPSFPASFPSFPASFPSFPASFPTFPASFPGHSQPLGMRLQPLRLQFRIPCSTQKSTVRLLGNSLLFLCHSTNHTSLPHIVLLQVTIICPYVVTCLATSNNNLPLRGDLSCYR